MLVCRLSWGSVCWYVRLSWGSVCWYVDCPGVLYAGMLDCPGGGYINHVLSMLVSGMYFLPHGIRM